MTIKKEEVIKANKMLCEEFNQQSAVINDANLDFAVDQYNHKDITIIGLCRMLMQGHCFLDANKRTVFVLYFYLTKVENSKNPLVTLPVIGLGLVEYTKRMLQQEPWYGWLKLLSEL